MPETLINCLLAACQHEEFKKLLGWKGLAVCPRGRQAWTLKLRDRSGIYGLCTEEECQHESYSQASLGLYYFPAADEPLLESMSLAANHFAIQEDYIESIRQFSSNENSAIPFRIGTVVTGLDITKSCFTLQLNADIRKICIARDGVMTQDGQWIISPGETEEDIPAHAIAMDFLLVLAAAVSNSIKIPPCWFSRTEVSGNAKEYDNKGKNFSSIHKTTTITDFLGWGKLEKAKQFTSQPFREFTASGTKEDRKSLPKPIDTALLWETHNLLDLARKGEHNYAFDDRPPLIVLSGFLGAGKTTFLNQLLEYYGARDELVAIIQNEIGKTGVDGKLLEGDDSIIELDEGCVCCTLAGNLSKGIEQLKSHFKPKVIVLETTGLANPFNILTEIEKLRPLVRLESITTLIDAENAPKLLAESDIARNQVKAADTIILNKCDLVSQKEQDTLAKDIHTLNCRALLVKTSNGAVNPGTIYDSDTRMQYSEEIMLFPLAQHQHTHAMEGFTSCRFAFQQPLSREDLKNLMTSLPKEVFRLKGIVNIAGESDHAVVQYVSGRYEISQLGNDFDEESFLVAIGKDMNLSILENLERSYA